jgi:sialidase-1
MPLDTVVFTSGTHGYHTFRIPAIVTTTKGVLLAFCEGRADSSSDAGNIDTVMRRSSDGGKTWTDLQVVAKDERNTFGNPCPIVDQTTGTVWLLLTRNDGDAHEGAILRGEAPPRTVWVTHSADEGVTWTSPKEISASARKEDWRWYATGPGHGIQLRDGTLAAPCNHSLSPDTAEWRSHVLLSKDHGKSWQLGGIHPGHTNESTLVELADGRLYQNMRNYKKTNRRAVAYSSNGGQTWTTAADDAALVEPVCQASALRYPNSNGQDYVLFSNPASTKRERMTLRLSPDAAATWPIAKELYAGPSAYSDLAIAPNGDILCLYERGNENPYESIVLARVPLAAITQGLESE